MSKKISYCHFIYAVFTSCLLVLPAGCSKNEDPQVEEKGTIEKMTDQAAETAVKKIRTPIDKARDSQSLGDDRLEEMDKAIEQQ
jgi:PBP1b-binding outer membrane lipoprotein LpoB